MRLTRWVARSFVLLALITFQVPCLLQAQNIVTGGISGTVMDQTGAVVVTAKVGLKSNATGETQETFTSATGLYMFPLLKPAPYTISVSQRGFRTVHQNIYVLLGQVATLDITLIVGSATETMEVTGAAPLLQTEDANLTTTFTPIQIENLPSPGGDITNFAQTAPGVVMNSGGGYGNFSAFGLPATSNLFTVNGNDENDPFLNLNNSGASNLLLGQNEVQEVAVVTNGYAGQYGRQAGVQVDYSTKSGTNAFHGNAVYWWNGSLFNANDWFQKQAETVGDLPNRPPFAVNNQWAGSFGGPIKKDKLFFFVDQEGLYYAVPNTQDIYLPMAGFSSALLGNIAANQPAQYAYYANLMNLYKGSPVYAQTQANPATFDQYGGCGPGFTVLTGFGGYNSGIPNPQPCVGLAVASGVNHNKEWLLTGRVDYNFSSADKLFGRFKMDHGRQPTTTNLIDPPVFSAQSNQPFYEGQINETHLFSPTVINNLIVSGLWYSVVFLPDSGQAAVISALGYSELVVGGGTSLSGLGDECCYAIPGGRKATSVQVSDDLSITRGVHTLTAGLNYKRIYFTDKDAQGLSGGYVVFGNLNDFVNGLVSAKTGGSLYEPFTTNGDVKIAYYSLGLYFQDEYRVTPKVKLTLVLREGRNSNPICASNCFSRLDTAFSGLTHDVNTPYDQIISTNLHSAFPSIEKLALEPRFGFTWSPLHLTHTVVRGGLGIFSDLYQAYLLDSVIGNSPGTNGLTVSPFVGAPVAPSVAGNVSALAARSNSSFLSAFSSGGTLASISASNPYFSPPGYFSLANQINNPKYLKWNLEIQQALGTMRSLSVMYVGTHGYDNLVQNGALNGANLTAIFTGTFTPFGQLPAGSISPTGILLAGTDPRFGTVTELSSTGVSNYAGLVTTFTQRMTHGLQLSFNYTFSHALDDITSSPGTPYNGSSTTTQVNPNNLRSLNYSSSDSDARHNVTANYVWAAPFRSQNKMLNYVAGGWSLAGTFFYHSGFPYGVGTYQSGVGFGASPLANFLGGPSGCSISPGNYPYAGTCLTASEFASPNLGGGVSQPGWGNIPRNYFRGPGYFDTDMSINKDFNVTEHAIFQLGGTFFNILNHPNFNLPNSDVLYTNFGYLGGVAIQPTTPYGAFQAAGIEGRLVQVHGRVTF